MTELDEAAQAMWHVRHEIVKAIRANVTLAEFEALLIAELNAREHFERCKSNEDLPPELRWEKYGTTEGGGVVMIRGIDSIDANDTEP